jgi:hypothetical protein
MIGRLTALGSTAVAALALAGSAPSAVSAPPAQLLAGTYQTKTGPGVAFEVNIVDDTTFPARTTFYVPDGYSLDLSRPPGSTIGRMDAFFFTSSSALSVWGSLQTGDPATLSGDPAAQPCAPGVHAAVWTASFKAGGKSHSLRVYVDATTGVDTALGAYKLVTCFEPPSASGLQLGLFDLSLSGPGGSVLTAPKSGTYVWRMFVTPYAGDTGTPNPGATFEARTHVFIPHLLSVRVRYRPKTQRLVVSGRLTALGRPRPNVRITIWAGARNDDLRGFGATKTRRDGLYSVSRRVREGRRARLLQVWVFEREPYAPCVEPSTAPAGCVDESLSPPLAQHRQVRIPKLPRR